MLTKQRKDLILERLRRDGQVIAAQLSAELRLSEDTVRRDLRELAAQGLLQRVHGGALPASPATATFEVRTEVEVEGKRTIARAAARMVRPGQVVFIDGGTTCLQLALALPSTLKASVVTHSPTIANELARHPGVDLVVIGGQLFKHSVVTVGAAAIEAIRRVHADTYFMGVTGVSAKVGLTTGDLEEAHVKAALMSQAAETWVLASAEKLNAASAYVVAPCRSATGLIVERATPAKDLSALKKLGLGIVRA